MIYNKKLPLLKSLFNFGRNKKNISKQGKIYCVHWMYILFGVDRLFLNFPRGENST